MEAATAYVTAALEIVDSRASGWDISIVDTIADDAASGLFVLGDHLVPVTTRRAARPWALWRTNA